ncbi:Histone deacetylase-like amidohydrolase [Methylophilaceae bacterium]|nr:Histone deacetylase-like amidohydrolase [Methylophilaceae bacterium]
MHTAYLTHPACLKHDMGAGHPECPERLLAINDQLIASGLMDYLDQHEAPKASKEELARVHAPEYVEWIFRQSPDSGLIHLDGDTAMNRFSLDAALHAAGAAVRAVDLVMSGQAQNAFCSVRPPGHHAGRASASGFCIFNNVAVGVAHAMQHHGLQRIAIADFDVHHGNGTEDIFRNHPGVMLCSTFRHPYYPYSGAGSGNDHIINVPLAAGSPGAEFRVAVSEHWLPALERFQPEFLFISAGFDAHLEDDMGGLSLKEADYLWVTELLKDVAHRYASDRIVSMLEGGYALHALGRCVMTHIKSLSGL